MSVILGDKKPHLGKSIYKLQGVAPKTQHWKLIENGRQIVDLGNDGGVTFNQGSIGRQYVIEVNYTDAKGIQHKAELAVTPIAGKPMIHTMKWQDEYYEDLHNRPVSFGDNVRLWIHTLNMTVSDTLEVTILTPSFHEIAHYTTNRVNQFGLAELHITNLRSLQAQLVNGRSNPPETFQLHINVKYKGKEETLTKKIDLTIHNEHIRKVPFPTNNKFVVVTIPDKQKPPKQKNGVKVLINIFFDGTKNNAKNTQARLDYQKESKQGVMYDNLSKTAKSFKDSDDDESSYDNYYSNVALLHKLNIVKKENKEIKVYIEGEGTENNEADDTRGYAFGSGDTGIPEKVNKGYRKINEEIAILRKKKFIEKNEIITEIEVNVFGFSRGAAAARHFVALKSKLQKQYNIESSKFVFKFVGLFETVSSYSNGYTAFPEFEHDQDELALEIEDVQKIVHLTAADEYREYFSLTTIGKAIDKGIGYELQLPGVHSDVGGGYSEIENEKRSIHAECKFEELEDFKKMLINQGWYTKKQIKSTWETVVGEPDAIRMGIPLSYQYIPLAIMIKLAEKYGVKFQKKEIDTKYGDFNVPEDLQYAKEALLNYALQNDGAHSLKVTVRHEYLMKLRNNYLHRSACDSTGKQGRYENGLPHRLIIKG